MKRIAISAGAFSLMLIFLVSCTPTQENPKTLPGKNLDLYAVLDLFKKSSSPKNFEKALNEKTNHINNLDLDSDGHVDFIRVIDNNEDNVHAIILRVDVAEKESQDVAVIEIEKTADKTAHLQIKGDADLYGENYFLEPKSEGSSASMAVTATVFVNVWAWPEVEYIYSPEYVVYVSPWHYEYYPEWYEEWEPVEWAVYDPYVEMYHPYFVVVDEPRLSHADRLFIQYHTRANFRYIEHQNAMGRQRMGNGFYNGRENKYRPDKDGDRNNFNDGRNFREGNADHNGRERNVNSPRINSPDRGGVKTQPRDNMGNQRNVEGANPKSNGNNYRQTGGNKMNNQPSHQGSGYRMPSGSPHQNGGGRMSPGPVHGGGGKKGGG